MGANWRVRLQQALTGKGSAAEGEGVAPEAESRRARVLNNALLAIADISDNPRQPRQTLDPDALSELAASIAVHGVLQPVLVRKAEDGYELVAGQRRLRAAEMAGLEVIPAVVLDVGDEDTGLLALVENLQREDLGYLEEAAAYERILRDFGLTQEELARRLGRSQSTIANKVRLLRLPSGIRSRLASSQLTERHARAILALKNEERQLQALDAAVSRGLTVRQTEQLVERLRAEELAEEAGRPARVTQKWRGVFRDARILSNTFRAAVTRLRRAGVEAELEEKRLPEGLEIRVLVRLPEGWADDRGAAGGRRQAGTRERGARKTGQRRGPRE